MNIVDELHAIAAALRGAGIPYAVCGGIAVTAYGATRSTKDIDVALPRDHLPAALAAVAPLGYTIPAGPMVFGEGTPNERHVQRVNKIAGADHLVLDLLLAEVVASRLAALAALYRPETVAEGRARLRADALAPDALASGVARRLDELRALDELARYLHRR